VYCCCCTCRTLRWHRLSDAGTQHVALPTAGGWQAQQALRAAGTTHQLLKLGWKVSQEGSDHQAPHAVRDEVHPPPGAPR
jgi:hypothetical protein